MQAVTSETDQREPRADGQDTNHACLVIQEKMPDESCSEDVEAEMKDIDESKKHAGSGILTQMQQGRAF